MIIFLFFFGGLFSALFSAFCSQGATQVWMTSLSCLLLNFGLLGALYRIEPRFVVYKFYVIFIAVQPLFLFLLVLLYAETSEYVFSNTSLFSGRAYTLYYSFTLTPALAVLFGAVLRPTYGNSGSRGGLKYYVELAGDRLNYLLFVGAVATIAIWFAAGLPTILGYGFRVLKGIFNLSPLVMGLRWRHSKALLLIWVGVLLLGLVFATLTGSRGYGFWPVIFFIIGVLMALRAVPRFWISLCLLVCMPVGLLLFGFIEHFRGEFGRKSLTEINIAEIIRFIPDALEASLSRGDGNVTTIEQSTGFSSLRRGVDMTMVFVPNMSPGEVDYRGYSDFHKEILGLLTFGGANLSSTIGQFYPTVLYARAYGFNVYMDVTAAGTLHSFTVPFAVLADSWSRFGIIAATANTLFLFAFFVLMEQINRRLFRRYPEVVCFGVIVLIDMALNFATAYSLLRSIRQTIVFYIGGCVVFLSANWARKRFFPRFLSSVIEGERPRGKRLR